MLLALDPLHPLVPIVVWAARALTFFNVMVLLWLGLTVLLNAERRRLGTWLTGGGLLLGGACSVARASAQAAQPIELFVPFDLWWRASLAAVRGSCLPLVGRADVVRRPPAHSGRVAEPGRAEPARPPDVPVAARSTPARGRPRGHRPRLGVPATAGVGGAGPSRRLWRRPPTLEVLAFETAPGDARLALASYLTFTMLCIGLGLHALYRPGNPDRFMGDLASRRARPWLTATSLVTLGLSLVVGIGATGVPLVTPPVLLDLLGAELLSGARRAARPGDRLVRGVHGQNAARRGLARYWRNALILAAGSAGCWPSSLGLPLDQSYRLHTGAGARRRLLRAALLAFVRGARAQPGQLRPFVTSERLIDHLTSRPSPLSRRGEGSKDDDPLRRWRGACSAPASPSSPGRAAGVAGRGAARDAGVGRATVARSASALVERIGSARQLCLPGRCGGDTAARPGWCRSGASAPDRAATARGPARRQPVQPGGDRDSESGRRAPDRRAGDG